MSLFDIPELRDDERDWVSPPMRTEADIQRLATLLSPPDRVYPCYRCSHNVSIVATGDPRAPARMICDPCGLPPTQCNCERIAYNAPT